jgi:hypothetical protein
MVVCWRLESFAGGLSKNPGRHAALVLDDGGLDWVDELATELCGELEEEGFVDTEAFDSVRREVTMPGEACRW